MSLLEEICPDFAEWPERWQGEPKDIPYGRSILDVFRSFAESMIQKSWSDETVRRHLNNLRLLGGEIITDVNTYEEHNIPPERKLRESVSDTGGRHCQHLRSAEEWTSYEATCRALHRFMQK